MGFLALSLGYMMRLNLSVAIVDMIVTKPQNYSLPTGYDDDTIETYFYPGINRDTSDNGTAAGNVCPYENGTEIIAVRR